MTYARAALAGLVLLAVAGCTGGDPAGGDPSDPPSSASPRATPSPTPTLAPPTIPPEAQEFGAKGAAAFVEYWYEAMRYSAMTGDSQILLDASTDECDTCSAMAKYDAGLHAAGGGYEDLPWEPTVTASQAERDYFVVTTTVATKRYRYRKTADAPWVVVSPKGRAHLFRLRNSPFGWRVIHLVEQAKAPR
ncbi:hypothetical protein KV097_05455 [Mumia sp. zg.B17]|uniref:DUF6318 family protein n=1 Tax=Mumia sp. zg.B17 TaxID=2855446 RepID=UPI001C6E91E8|nr:DUF6318 family protein [Mumia sp. zg.B17]MBW9205385.1 hypothetical protein [Mumia sp. zg.B17]